MDMSSAYAKGAGMALPQADISYDRFHVIAMAIQAMDDVRREEMRTEPEEVATALLGADPKTRRNLLWGMRKNPKGWTAAQTTAMHWLQRSALKSARAWRLRMALREVYVRARQHNSSEHAAQDLRAWTSWARRCRLEPFKKLAATIKERFDAVVRGMLDHRSNAFVESMNSQLQLAKRAARGYRTAGNFIAIAYLRLSRLKNLPAHPFSAAAKVG
jgi:transposase